MDRHRVTATGAFIKLFTSCVVTALAGMLLAAGTAAAGGLWVPNALTLSEFQSKFKKPFRINRSADLSGVNAVAFDASGNIWVTNFNPNTIVKFSMAQMSATKKKKASAPHALVTISEDSGGNLNGPEGLAIDGPTQNMWVGSERGQVILMYTPAQYAASGSPTPSVILNASSFSFSSPSNVLFDSSGNLWVVDENIPNGNGSTGEIFRYNRAQILGLSPGTHFIDPAFGIGFQDFVHLEGLTFDPAHNMWVADESTNLIYKFSTSQLGGTGLSQNLTPPITLSSGSQKGACNQTMNNPYGIAFDSSGNLFVADAFVSASCPGSLAEFSASSITASGVPVPKVFVKSKSGNVNDPGYLTFGPSIN